ncbi:MAG: preprotein translocase subunit SecG [Spirochaetia bacterium]|nr:preprotein translocase subunit SecG [Spirochaetia bacterium]
MAVLSVILLILFCIVSVLLMGVILLQDDQGDGLGGIFGGSNNSSVGLQSGNILTRFTGILAVLFFVLSLSLMMVYTKSYSDAQASDGVEAEINARSGAEKTWIDEIQELNAENNAASTVTAE